MKGAPGQPSKSHLALDAGALYRDRGLYPQGSWGTSQELTPSLCTPCVTTVPRDWALSVPCQAFSILPSLLLTRDRAKQWANECLVFQARLSVSPVGGEDGVPGHFQL